MIPTGNKGKGRQTRLRQLLSVRYDSQASPGAGVTMRQRRTDNETDTGAIQSQLICVHKEKFANERCHRCDHKISSASVSMHSLSSLHLLIKHPLTHSLTHSPAHSTTHSLIHSLTRSLNNPLTHSLAHSPTPPTHPPRCHGRSLRRCLAARSAQDCPPIYSPPAHV